MVACKRALLGRWLFRVSVFLLVLPLVFILPLRWFNPVTTSFILQHNVSAWFNGRDSAVQHWADWDAISMQMALAVIAAEDQRFPDHFGIDFKGLHRALSDNRARKRGASTITQQTVKNLFLWPGRNWVRKGLEAILAIYTEALLSKQRILEIYLNIAQTGSGLFGAEAAAQTYFRKSAAMLNQYESARIAATLPNPDIYSVKAPSRYILKRQQWILKQMKQLGGVQFLRLLR